VVRVYFVTSTNIVQISHESCKMIINATIIKNKI